jgi:hypothetical protein
MGRKGETVGRLTPDRIPLNLNLILNLNLPLKIKMGRNICEKDQPFEIEESRKNGIV